MVTARSSSGWRSISSTERGNSSSSSRNSTPLCASEISPGRTVGPPADQARRRHRVVRRAERARARPAPSRPAGRRSNTPSSSPAPRRTPSGGRIPGSRWASMVLPEPGGPTNSRLWPPAAAISSARRGTSCPRTSARSSVVARRGAPVATPAWPRAPARRARLAAQQRHQRGRGSAAPARRRRRRSRPRRRCRAGRPAGARRARAPRRRSAARRAPAAACRRAPARRRTACRPARAASTAPAAASMPTAIGTSNAAPSLRRSAGARLTVVRRGGSLKPLLSSAPRMRTRPSRMPASASPTMLQHGSPTPTSTSTSMGAASIPTTAADATRANMPRCLCERDASANAARHAAAPARGRRPADAVLSRTCRSVRSRAARSAATERRDRACGAERLERQAQAEAAR